MYTGDPYRGMEVSVIHGPVKSRNATVVDTREWDGKEWAIVIMENTIERLPVSIEVDHLLEHL